MQERLKVGLYGFEPHPFRSLNRTRRFYLEALGCFELVPITGREAQLPPLDALISFWGEHFWQPMERDFPVFTALHGGPVLGIEQLAQRLAGLDRNDGVIVNCSSDSRIVHNLVEQAPRVLQLPLPVDQGFFLPRDTLTARRALGLEQEDLLLGFCGRLMPQKNVHRFLRMLAAIRDRLPHRRVRGLVIGDFQIGYDVLPYVDREYQGQVEALERKLGLEDSLILPGGSLPLITLTRMLSAMDLLIHPTNTIDENFGYTAIESMACGTPVVGCAYGGLKDTVPSPQAGYLMDTWVTPGGIRADYASGIDAACRILESATKLHDMSRQAVQHVDRHFGFEYTSCLLTDAIREAVAARRAQGAQKGNGRVRQAPGRDDLLPPIDPPFGRYRYRCESYANRATPTIDDLCRVEPFASLTPLGEDRYQTSDPCWPSIHRLNRDERRLLDLCGGGIEVARLRSLIELPDRDFSRLANRLLAQGLLIGSFRDGLGPDQAVSGPA